MTSKATRLAEGVFVALGASRRKCYSVPLLTFIRCTSRSIENKLLIGAVANAVAQGVGRGPEHAGLVVLVSFEPLFHPVREVFFSFRINEKSTDHLACCSYAGKWFDLDDVVQSTEPRSRCNVMPSGVSLSWRTEPLERDGPAMAAMRSLRPCTLLAATGSAIPGAPSQG
jgi:hypothetical protein